VSKQYFKNAQTFKASNDGIIKAYEKGILNFEVRLENGQLNTIQIDDVYYSDDSSVNILSVSRLTKSNSARMIFRKNICHFMMNNDVVFKAYKDSNTGLYVLPIFAVSESDQTENEFVFNQIGISNDKNCVDNKRSKYEVWHERYGHINPNYLRRLLKENLVKGIDLKPNEIPTDANCETCTISKSTKLPYKTNHYRAESPLQLVHTDVVQMPCESVNDGKYFVTFLDDFSHYCVTYEIKSKDEVFSKFKIFKAFAEKQTGHYIKAIRSDNGKEYVNNNFTEFLEVNGISRQLTCPFNPSSNGRAERLNRTLNDCTRSMLYQSNLPKSFWPYALDTAVYLKNISPCSEYKLTPFELFFNYKPDVSHLRTFGSICYAHVDKPTNAKLNDRAIKCIFLGYKFGAYKVLDLSSNQVRIARNVKFVEDEYSNISQNGVNSEYQHRCDDALSRNTCENNTSDSEDERVNIIPEIASDVNDGNSIIDVPNAPLNDVELNEMNDNLNDCNASNNNNNLNDSFESSSELFDDENRDNAEPGQVVTRSGRISKPVKPYGNPKLYTLANSNETIPALYVSKFK